MTALWGIHIADGLVRESWLIGGYCIAAVLLVLSVVKIDANKMPLIALMSSAFFVASLIHIKMPGTSVHLLFNGVVGLLLGRFAPMAIFMGLTLQATLFGHGGWTTLGVNTVIMTLPALMCGFIVRRSIRRGNLRQTKWRWLVGFSLGGCSVLLTLALYTLVLLIGTHESHDLSKLAYFVLVAHLPVIFIEAMITATLLDFLFRVQPSLLGVPDLRVGPT